MRVITAFLLSILLPGTAFAGSESPDLAVRFGRYHASTTLQADGTAVETHEWSRTVLKESALEESKRASVGYSTSTQTAEVLAAYTQKADGRQIAVPKDNYQIEVNQGQGKDSPVYSDWTTMTVVFPDVAVGDSVVLSYRVTDKTPMFPGHYSTGQLFYRHIAYDDIRIRIDYPATMTARHEGRGMKETLSEKGGQNGRKVVEWTWANPAPVKSERRNWSVFDPDREVGYAFSTFADYAVIAAAYGARATPRAAVTPRITQLAADIVQGKNDRKAQARALYEWVASNITYAGNCIGVGAVVPRELDFVLDNKMGDCKDHATLLQALLAARGIGSTQALVNAGALYALPRIPVVQSVNHVINYLPEFDLFADATSDATPFGLLPFNDQDKPVLLVDGFRAGLKTPVPPAGNNQQTTRSVLKVAGDGSVTGTMEVRQRGYDAIQMRAAARQMSRDTETDLVQNVFRRMGVIGSGSFEKDDPAALTDSYRYKASFKAEKFIRQPGAGAFYIHPPLGLAPTILAAAQSAQEPDAEFPATCTGGTLVEEFAIELPKGLKVLSLPQDLKIATPLVSYQASYRRKGNRIDVKRTLDDRTTGNVCSPQVFAEYRKVAERIIDNLKEQVLYK